MAATPDLDAKEVLEKLREFGDNSNPQKQIYKSQIAGRTVELFDLTGRSTFVRAEAIEEYVAKTDAIGRQVFGLAPPVPPEEVRPIRRGKTVAPPAPDNNVAPPPDPNNGEVHPQVDSTDLKPKGGK